MRHTVRRPRRAALAIAAITMAAVMSSAAAVPASGVPPTSAGTATADVAPPPTDWPTFGYQGIITDKSKMTFNPTNEYIFPSVFHAGAHLDNPLGEWYLYTAPHDPAPQGTTGGILLMYSDSLEGPWTEYEANPIITNRWDDHYAVSHISSPDAIWNEEAGKMFLYFHGENSVSRYASTDDGINFEYGDIVVSNAMGGPNVTESSYARVFEHPDPESEFAYGMFYMGNERDDIRRIRLAESVDGVTWTVDPDYVVAPGAEEGKNVSAANLWEWNDQLYVVYHASSGKSYARTIDPTLRDVGARPIVLHQASGLGTDVGRVASPEVVTDDNGTYLFYESGDRLGATIAWAKAGADPVIDPPFGGFPADADNPVFDTCAAPGSDEFDDGLGEEWSRTVREDLARHVTTNGALTIPTYEGGVAAAPLLQQQLPEGAWQLTTKVGIDPTLNYQQAGLLLYATDTDYVKLNIGKARQGRVVELVSAGSPVFTTQQRYDGSEVWLRLTSDGMTIEASLSHDGAAFGRIGSLLDAESVPGTPRFTHVGPFAFRGGAAVPEIEASFDWFRFSPKTADYETCMTDPGTDPEDPDDPTDPGDTLGATLTHSERAPGQEQTVVGTGFGDGEQVVGVMNSEPLDLGMQTANADGEVVFTWTIPRGTEAGSHTVTLTGIDSGEVSAQFRVTRNETDDTGGGGTGDSSETGDLASTGTNPGAAWAVSIALLLAGTAAMLVTHRHRRQATE